MRSPSPRLRAVASLLGLYALLLASRADATLTVAGFGDSMTWHPGYLAELPSEWQTLNLSFGGEHSWDGLTRLGAVLPTIDADVIVLMEGTNDVRSALYSETSTVQNLSAMMDLALAQGLDVVLMAPPPLKPSYPNGHLYDPLLESLAGALASVAAARGVAFVDLYALFRSSSSMESFYYDDIHPSEAGNAFIAQAAEQAVRQAIAPEPSTGLLVAAGCALLACRKRARRP